MSKITGGNTSVIAQQHTPPTYPRTAPKFGINVAHKAANKTNAERTINAGNLANSFAGSLFVKTDSHTTSADCAMIGNVNNKFTHNKPFTKTPIGPSNMVMTTDETFGPKPTAQIIPKRPPTMALNTNALDAAPKNFSFCGIPC